MTWKSFLGPVEICSASDILYYFLFTAMPFVVRPVFFLARSA